MNYKLYFQVFFFLYCLTSNAQLEQWSVNSSDFQYSMTFVSELSNDNQILISQMDKVAAFVNGECRGVSNVVYNTIVDKYVSYLSVYANTSGETVSFKVYNSNLDTILEVENTMEFSIDKNHGNAIEPFVFSTTLNLANLTSITNQNSLAIYPMPFGTKVNIAPLINSLNTLYTVQVLDLNGKLIDEVRHNFKTELMLDTEGFPYGPLMFKILNDNRKLIQSTMGIHFQ